MYIRWKDINLIDKITCDYKKNYEIENRGNISNSKTEERRKEMERK